MKSKIDSCIFCGQVPCVCNSKKPEKPARKIERVEAPTLRKSSHLDAMKEAAAQVPVTPSPEEKKSPWSDMSEEDIIWNAAIRNLAPLMSESDKETYAGIIYSKPHPDEAKMMWKARRQTDG